LAEDPETSLYVHCKGCQEPYLKADFHCSHSHENFTKDQEDSFKAHTKRIANEIPNESRYPKLSVEFKVLKAVLFDIEAAIPEEAVRSEGRGNSRKIWLEKLKASLSIQQVIPCVQDLEKKTRQGMVKTIVQPIQMACRSSWMQDSPTGYRPSDRVRWKCPLQTTDEIEDGISKATSAWSQ